MDRFLAMKVFATVVEQGSFARAADKLDLSVSACSRQVAELEAHLGTRLMHRTTRRLSLTESGTLFHERCLDLLAAVEEAEQEAASSATQAKGTLRISCSINFGVRHLAPAVGEFLAANPHVKLDVSLADRYVDLVEEGYDLAVRIGQVTTPTLIARRLGETRLVPCASPEYLRRHGTPQKPADLAQHACLTYEYLAMRNVWRFRDRRGREQSVRVAGPMHANNGDLLAAAAIAGIGIAMEPDFIVAEDLAEGRLVALLPEYEPPAASIFAVYPSRRHLSAKVRVFVDFLAARFAGASWHARTARRER
jgi:DNA-binding transcriptional LysR family regulator